MDAPSLDGDRSSETGEQPAPVLGGVAPLVDHEAERRARIALCVLVTLYALALGLLYSLGLFGFFWKTVVAPSLFIVAYLARRFRAFVRDWAVFLGAVVLFDSARGLIYGFVLHFQRRVYMGYAIDFERTLFGAPIPSARLQQVMAEPGEVSAVQKALVMLHASHFLVFLLFGLLLWLVREREFVRFKMAILLVMYIGIACYAIWPTVPPWMASSRFFVLEPVEHIPQKVYNLAIPTLTESFDLNPIAAMPSLHAAFPTLLALVCFETFGAWGFLMAAYALSVCFAIIALGEHYVVDVMLGTTLALSAYAFAFRSRFADRWFEARKAAIPEQPSGSMWQAARGLAAPLAASALLLILAQGSGAIAYAWHGREVPTEAFITHELDGKSPMANYYRGLNAYYASDFARAQRFLLPATREVPDTSKQSRAFLLLGESAFHNGDDRTAADVLAAQPKLSAEQALMLAEARLKLGQRELGFEVLDYVSRTFPRDSALQAQRSRLEQQYGRSGTAHTARPN